MELRVCGSSSKGNAYALCCNDEILLIEAGCKLQDIFKNIDYKLSSVKGLVYSHSHGDHSKYAHEFVKMGFPVYTHPAAVEASGFIGLNGLDPKKKLVMGGFKIQAIEVKHNVPCYSFVIDCPDTSRVLFITDCADFPWKVNGVNHLLCEANYMEDIILDRAARDEWSASASNNHLSIEQSVSIIKRHFSAKLQTVVLLHLSDGNSDENRFREMVKRETGIEPYIADSEMKIKLDLEEF